MAIPARRWTVPEGEAIYAVGDIHGRLDLLTVLLDRITEDAAREAPRHAPDHAPGHAPHHVRAAAADRRWLVFLGDYVDRGPESRGVIERLLRGPPPGFQAVHLRGNHEQAMLDFLEAPERAAEWLGFGGEATLHSYGVGLPAARTWREALRRMRDGLAAALPAPHRRFLDGLDHTHRAGDYLFVHAGIRPGRPLAAQHPHDLLWIRDEFLTSAADHGCVVVHGHSITDTPEIRHNRIGIDTGAFATGRLTCLVLEGTGRRFLSS